MRHLIALVLISLIATTARAQSDDNRTPPRTISSFGEAIVHVVPNEVDVSVGIEKFDANLDKAKSANDEAAGTLLKAIKSMGIEERQIQTSTLNVRMQYRSDRPSNGIEGFYCQRTYQVTLKDTKQLEKLVDAMLKNGANQLFGIGYRTTELRKYRDQARKMAIAAAKEKAAALSGELGMKIGKPRSIIEDASYPSYYGANRWMQNVQMQANDNAPGGDAIEAGELTPVGQIDVHARVSVVFDLSE
jgi:uncharacterized protein YggE